MLVMSEEKKVMECWYDRRKAKIIISKYLYYTAIEQSCSNFNFSYYPLPLPRVGKRGSNPLMPVKFSAKVQTTQETNR